MARNSREVETFFASSSDAHSAELNAQEAALVAKAQRGDRNAFTALMGLYRERVMRLTFHMIGNQEDAQDLCQETFVKVYRSLGQFDRKRSFAPWIYRIAHNVILDFLRRKKARPTLIETDSDAAFEDGPDERSESPQASLLSKETYRDMIGAIQSLPESYRSVIVFRYIDDLSYAEIAAALNLTEANVMMRVSRARRMLREKLQALHTEE